MKVTVAILTFNYGKKLLPLLEAIERQERSFQLHLLIIDSSTQLSYFKDIESILHDLNFSSAEIEHIENKEFSHGATRNMCLRRALDNGSQFIAFITQDAIPKESSWLQELLKPFTDNSLVAISFGHQEPKRSANPVVTRWLTSFFANFQKKGDSSISFFKMKNGKYEKLFNSNVNACYNLTLLKNAKLDFGNVPYAEDLKIAKQTQERGLVIAYNRKATVLHSHSWFWWNEYLRRAFDDTWHVNSILFFEKPSETRLSWIIKRIYIEYKTDLFYMWSRRCKKGVYTRLVWTFNALLVEAAHHLGRYLGGKTLYLTENQKTILSRELFFKNPRWGYKRLGLIFLILEILFNFRFDRKRIVQMKKARLDGKSLRHSWQELFLTQFSKEPVFNNPRRSIFEEFYPFSSFLFLDEYLKQYSEIKHTAGQKLTRKSIVWIIPSFRPTDGGITDIFRIAYGLERKGYRNKFLVIEPHTFSSARMIEKLVQEKLFPFEYAEFDFLPLYNLSDVVAEYLIVTSWQTAYYGKLIKNVKKKFYFVQDYEPVFFSYGDRYRLAEQTYSFGYKFIALSPWLKQLLQEKYGMSGDNIFIGVDNEEFFKIEDVQKEENSVAFYIREHTQRRGTDLGLDALSIAQFYNPKLKVFLFGQDGFCRQIPLRYTSLGGLSRKEMNILFNSVSLGMTFSFTNYSIVPQEMNAVGLPVIDIDWKGNRINYGDRKGVVLVQPNVIDIAKKINNILLDERKLCRLSKFAYDESGLFRWQEAIDKFERILIDL